MVRQLQCQHGGFGVLHCLFRVLAGQLKLRPQGAQRGLEGVRVLVDIGGQPMM